MNCPVCKNVNLMMSERQGIEIDYCPQCRGVWLDRGELDKLIDKASPAESSEGEAYRGQAYREEPRYRSDAHHGKHYRKRKGLLGELFDFD